MDRLDEMLGSVGPLLRRVDEILTVAGAPPDHPVWTELRRVRLLPWDAAQAVAALRAGELTEVAAELRATTRSYAELADALPAPGIWTGDAADAYDEARRRVAAHLSGGVDSLDERLSAAADLADATADWMTRTRDGLAAALAAVGTSAEALSLSFSAGADPPAAGDVRAAAEVAARVLGAVADGYESVPDVRHGSTDLTVALSHGVP